MAQTKQQRIDELEARVEALEEAGRSWRALATAWRDESYAIEERYIRLKADIIAVDAVGSKDHV